MKCRTTQLPDNICYFNGIICLFDPEEDADILFGFLMYNIQIKILHLKKEKMKTQPFFIHSFPNLMKNFEQAFSVKTYLQKCILDLQDLFRFPKKLEFVAPV